MKPVVLDEHGLKFADESVDAVENTLRQVTSLIDAARSTGFSLRRVSWIFEVQSAGGTELWQTLFARPDLDRDVTELASREFDQMEVLDDSLHGVLDVDDCGGERLELAGGIAVTVTRSGDFESVMLTTDQSRRGGTLRVRVGADLREVLFIIEAAALAEAARRVLDEGGPSQGELETLATTAYPATVFADGIWRQCRRFVGGLSAVWPELLHSLAVLNDRAPSTFAASPQANVRAAALASDNGVSCSPESPSTHKNSSAMRERDADFGGRVVRCEWHVKLHPTHNRIHFAVEDARVLVGIFVDHLTT